MVNRFFLDIDNTHLEKEMALAFCRGEERGLEYFYTHFFPALALYASRWVENRQVAEEIASEALVKTWRLHYKLDNFGGIRAYLYKTVQRDCLHHQQRERKRHGLSYSPEVEADSDESPFQHLVKTETYRLLHSAIRLLSPGNRRVITMHFMEGKSTGQIARELKLHPHTVQTQKARGLKALRKILRHPFLISFYLFVKFFLGNL